MAENDFDAVARRAAARFAEITGRAAGVYEAFKRLEIYVRAASYNADRWTKIIQAGLSPRRPGRWQMPPEQVMKKARKKRRSIRK